MATPFADSSEKSVHEYSEAIELGEVQVTYGRVMMIGAGGAGKTSLRHGLMKKQLPKMAFSTLLANSLSVKCQWAGALGQSWVEIEEEDEIEELAILLSRIIDNKSLLPSVESASAIKDFQPFTQLQTESPQSTTSSSNNLSEESRKVVAKPKLVKKHQMEGTQSASSSSRDHSDVVEEIKEKIFAKVRLAKLHHQPRSEVLLNLWDSGGQLVFMNVLPAFLTRRTLFMLVFDASKNLETKLQFQAMHAGEIVHIEDYHLNTTELLLQWMASIDAHLSQRNAGAVLDPYPRIMLIGTHLDQLVSKGCNPAVVTKTVLDSLHFQYKEKKYADLLMPSPGYVVDNTTAGQDKEDPAFQTVRECVHEFVATNFTVPTPITWVLFRKVMQAFSQANKPVMRYGEVVAVAEACSVPTRAVPSVLNFYHELGVFLYYSKIPSLREVIIATPQWLVDHFAKVLTPHGLEDHGRERQWTLLHQKGILTETLYTEILQNAILNPQAVVDLLEHFLLAVPIKTTRIHFYIGKEYFVPCMLDAPSESIPCHFPFQRSTDVHTTEPMHLILNTHYVPPGFYIRLLASIAKHEDCNIVFEQSSRYTVTFDYQEVDEITMRERSDSIEIQVTRVAQGGPHVPPFHRVCRNVIKLVNDSIKEVNIWLPSVSVSTAFVCSCCSSDLPRHFVTFDQGALTTTTVKCQKNKRQQLGQLQSQKYWLNIPETTFDSHDSRPTTSQIQHTGLTEVPPQQQPVIHPPSASQAIKNWEYQAISNNSSAITSALADNSLANILADELRSRKLIGKAVHTKATSNDPDITEYSRVKQIITAMLSKIQHNPQRYHDFIYVLQLDGICEDAEAALALLPTGVDSAREQMDTLQPVHSSKGTTQKKAANYLGDTIQGTTEICRGSSSAVPRLVDLIDRVTTPRWFDLGLALGVDDSSLRFIEQDTRGDSRTGLRRMFQEWLSSCEQPSWDNVIWALRRIEESRLAELCQKLCIKATL